MADEAIEFERLEGAIKALNDLDLVEKIEYSLDEGFDPHDLLDRFMKATESIPFEKEKGLPDIIVDLYNEVADKVKTTAAEDPCEMYGTGWDSKHKDCKRCRKDYPDEYEKCKEMKQTAQSEDVPQKKEEKKEVTIPPKEGTEGDLVKGEKFEALKKKILGKDDSKLTSVIDKLLLAGGSVDEMFKKVAKEAKGRGLKTFTNSASEISGLAKSREKSGWVFERGDAGYIKLVGYSK